MFLTKELVSHPNDSIFAVVHIPVCPNLLLWLIAPKIAADRRTHLVYLAAALSTVAKRTCKIIDRYCGGKGSGDLETARHVAKELAGRMLSSSERVIMLTLQDSLLLDDSARMNVPGTTDGRNWNWQAREEDLDRLSYMHAAFRTL